MFSFVKLFLLKNRRFNLTLLFFKFLFYLAGLFISASGFLELQRGVATLSCSVWASPCGGVSCCRAQALGRADVHSCGTWAQ